MFNFQGTKVIYPSVILSKNEHGERYSCEVIAMSCPLTITVNFTHVNFIAPLAVLFPRLCRFVSVTAVIGELALLDERVSKRQSWLTYDIKLKEIIKKSKTNLKRGDYMDFKKRSGCACPDLEERKEYLIMGKEEGSFFVFDKTSFVVPWERKRKNNNLDDLRARVGIDPRCFI